LSSKEGELARSIITCAPAMASLSPSPVMVLTPLLGEAATTSWPPWNGDGLRVDQAGAAETIFMIDPPLSLTRDPQTTGDR
jgi:hypothetical protein